METELRDELGTAGAIRGLAEGRAGEEAFSLFPPRVKRRVTLRDELIVVMEKGGLREGATTEEAERGSLVQSSNVVGAERVVSCLSSELFFFFPSHSFLSVPLLSTCPRFTIDSQDSV